MRNLCGRKSGLLPSCLLLVDTFLCMVMISLSDMGSFVLRLISNSRLDFFTGDLNQQTRKQRQIPQTSIEYRVHVIIDYTHLATYTKLLLLVLALPSHFEPTSGRALGYCHTIRDCVSQWDVQYIKWVGENVLLVGKGFYYVVVFDVDVCLTVIGWCRGGRDRLLFLTDCLDKRNGAVNKWTQISTHNRNVVFVITLHSCWNK